MRAGWDSKSIDCRLAMDWAALRIDRATATLTAPAIANVHDANAFRPGIQIPVELGKGWFLVVESV